MSESLTRIRRGLLANLDLTGVADGTELNGFRHWHVFENGGSGNNLLEIRGQKIRTKVAGTAIMAQWFDPTVAWPGHCVRSNMTSPLWTGGHPLLGLVVNGSPYDPVTVRHASDIRAFYYDQYELRTRLNTPNDYGQGFSIRTGAMPVAMPNGSTHLGTLGLVQDTVRGFTQMSAYIDGQPLGLPQDTEPSTGINTGEATYPGIIYWNDLGGTWDTYTVYRDYRIIVDGLFDTQGFRLYNGVGTVLKSSAVQSGGKAHVDVGDLAWPITGYLQVFDDAGTWSVPRPNMRWPEFGNRTDFVGGDYLEMATDFIGLQANWLLSKAWPEEWDQPYVNIPCIQDLKLRRQGSQGTVLDETLTAQFLDLESIYSAGNPASPLAPLVQLGVPVRLVIRKGGAIDCLWYGEISRLQTLMHWPYETIIEAQSPIHRYGKIEILPPFYLNTPVYDSTSADTIAASPLIKVLSLAGIDEAHRDIDPGIYDTLTRWGGEAMTLSEALSELARVCSALYWIQPIYKTAPSQVNFKFRWQKREAKLDATPDIIWVAATDHPQDIQVELAALS